MSRSGGGHGVRRVSMKALDAGLGERKRRHLYRTRRLSASAQQVVMHIDGRQLISFCSNDYLGLANHREVKQAFIQAANDYGVGSGASHLISGHHKLHHQLEEALAEFTGYPRALLFSTGYMANLGVIQALTGRGDTVLEDRLNHASLLDGALLSGARLMRYAHNDVAQLKDKLQTRHSGEKLVVSDAVFSMDGDLAPIAQLVASCRAHDAWLMLDDAHGFGVLGEDGKGSLQHSQTAPTAVPVYMATLGKALGTAGAFVAADEALIDTLIQQARTYVYTTAQPPAIAAAALQALRIVQRDDGRRQRLQQNIRVFKSLAQQAGIALLDSDTAIQPVIVGDAAKALRLSNALLDAGLLVTAIRPPTVPEGSARLRITLCAEHEATHIERLCSVLAREIQAFC